MKVSRETEARLEAFEALVRKWNPAINLVSKATLDDLRKRHIEDSVQVFEFAGATNGHWVDLGSGGGFPGVVVAILALELAPNLRVTCIESDQRKATFLRTALTQLGTNATVLAQRIEDAAPQAADVVSARALAPLVKLIPMAQRHLAPGGIAIFPKGVRHAMELADARTQFSFDATSEDSRTEPGAKLLRLEGLVT